MPAFVRSLAAQAGLEEVEVGRDYRMRAGEADEGLCFLLGVNERTHGIADSLLSVQAARAKEVADVLAAAARRDAARGAALRRSTPVPASPEGFIRRLDVDGLVHENGLDAQRLVPCPLVTPFEASWCVIRPGTASTPHGHHEAEIFVAVEGEARLEAYGRSEVFRKGDTAFFRPGVPHRVVNEGDADFVMYSIWWDDAMSVRQLEQFAEKPRRIA
jgi:mannose-6-phosphate isomerase-like protein (cupin superfamily)